MLIYVDDIIVKRNDCKLIQTIVSQVNSFFSLKYVGDLHYFEGIGVTHHDDGSLTII